MRLIATRDLYYLLVICLVCLVGMVPSSRLKDRIARLIALTAYGFSATKRKLIARNASLALEGQLGQQKLRSLSIGSLQGVWQEMLSWLPADTRRSGVEQVKIHGLERLRVALGKRHGVILWESNGFGIRILAKKALHATGFFICQVHGADNLGGFLTDDSEGTWVRSKWIKAFFDRCERHFVREIINLPRSDSLAAVRQISKSLQQNGIVCVSGDGKLGRRLISLDFLRHREFFASGMISLARLTGATILPLFCIREKNGERHLFIEPPIPVNPDNDREVELTKSLSAYVSLMEGYVRKYPEQYRNWHLLGNQPAGAGAADG